ncbi:MAG: hypothetical protein U0556_09955 [Dehalococcoidia bacterium]
MADWNLTWEGPLGEDQPVDDLASLLLHFKELQPDQTPMVSLAHFLASDDRAAAMPPALAAELIANGVLGDAAEILAMEAAQPVVAPFTYLDGRSREREVRDLGDLFVWLLGEAGEDGNPQDIFWRWIEEVDEAALPESLKADLVDRMGIDLADR